LSPDPVDAPAPDPAVDRTLLFATPRRSAVCRLDQAVSAIAAAEKAKREQQIRHILGLIAEEEVEHA